MFQFYNSISFTIIAFILLFILKIIKFYITPFILFIYILFSIFALWQYVHSRLNTSL